MLFRKNKVEINNSKYCTHIIVNGQDISDSITEFTLTQKGGERPKLEIICNPKKLDMTLEKLEKVKVKVNKTKD